MADKKAAADTSAAKAEGKTKKAEPGKKKVPFFTKVKNTCGRVVKYFKDTKSELKKVVWPSKEQVRTNTITVVIVVVVAAVVMILLDLIFGGVIHLMIG